MLLGLSGKSKFGNMTYKSENASLQEGIADKQLKPYRQFYEQYFNENSYLVQLYDIGERSDRLTVQQLMKTKSGVLLNLGCGLGDFRCDDENFFNVGIDISIKSCSIAKKLFSSGHYLVADVKNLPIKDNAADSVVSIDVLEHIPNDKSAIDEIFRVLKCNGETILHVPGNYRGAVSEVSKKYGHLRAYNENALKALLSNFQVEKLQHQGIFINFFWLKLKKILKAIRIVNIIFSMRLSVYIYYLNVVKQKFGWLRKGEIIADSLNSAESFGKFPSFYELSWYQNIILPFLERFIYRIDTYISKSKILQRIGESNINIRAVKRTNT